MNPMKILGMALLGVSGIATIALALGVLGLASYFGYLWGGIIGGILAFWIGGSLAFVIVYLAILPLNLLASIGAFNRPTTRSTAVLKPRVPRFPA